MCQDTPAQLEAFARRLEADPGDAHDASFGLSRRSLLVGALAGAAAGVLPGGVLSPSPADAWTRPPRVRARSEWAGGDCPVRGPLAVEAAGDVRFLEVHHSVVPGNDYGPEQVPAVLRAIYRGHVDRGWPDLAYNLVVDRFGRVWEGRAGSRAAAVVPSATGGHQGFSQKVCFLGDHSTVAPTPVMNDRMVAVLAGLARRHGIRTAPGSTAEFVSRGSTLLPAGTACSVPTIVGHRQVVRTACPGDAAFRLVQESYPARVSLRVRASPVGTWTSTAR